MAELRRQFRPEFLNRVDDVILFKPLKLEEIKRIVDLMIEDVAKRLKDRHIKLVLSEEAREFIARSGYDPVYGARPLRRYIQRHLETMLARAIIAGDIKEGAIVHVRVENGSLTVVPEYPESEAEVLEAKAL
jgi:ATP-dependent Clp protease ATP-binding subunit ClpB